MASNHTPTLPSLQEAPTTAYDEYMKYKHCCITRRETKMADGNAHLLMAFRASCSTVMDWKCFLNCPCSIAFKTSLNYKHLYVSKQNVSEQQIQYKTYISTLKGVLCLQELSSQDSVVRYTTELFDTHAFHLCRKLFDTTGKQSLHSVHS